jgi:hypothetical protein
MLQCNWQKCLVDMRIQIVENGKVLPGQETNFRLLCERKAKKLQEIDANFRREDPDTYKDFPIPDLNEARKSLISASRRFGDGSIWIEDTEFDNDKIDEV